jgi:hypothetical protein
MFGSLQLNRIRRQIIVIVGISVLLVALSEIWSINRLAILGLQISKMEQSKMSLQLENQILQTQIADKSSLRNVENIATKLGFEGIKKLSYVKDLNLASK